MTLYDWAHKWNIDPNALNDLLRALGALSPTPSLKTGESEAAIQVRVRLDASKQGGRLWRNNVGACTTDKGDFIRFGLANDSTAVNKKIKSSDLIGLKPVAITQEMVGQVIGQFVAREVKAANWKYRGTQREVAQLAFLNLVTAMGGDAKFTNGTDL